MASYVEITERLARLIDEGVIYEGQPTDLLKAHLLERSSRWKGGRWGNGPNEDMVTLVAFARTALYEGNISSEAIALDPHAYVVARKAVADSRRADGSPYAVDVGSLAAMLRAAKKEGAYGECMRRIHGDSKSWWELPFTFSLLPDIPYPASWSLAIDWFHRYQIWANMPVTLPDNSVPWLYREPIRKRREFRLLLVGWAIMGSPREKTDLDWVRGLSLAEAQERLQMLQALV